MTQSYGLQGRVVVLTGAASGIGRALAQAFAQEQAELVLVDRGAGALQEVAESLAPLCKVHAHECDLSDDAAVQAVAARIAQVHPQVDLLVNNAGVEHPTPLSDTSDLANGRWGQLLDNNVTSMVRLTRALLPHLRSGASIINQASI